MKQYYRPRVIMSIHGYMSKGQWQDSLDEIVKTENLISAPYKYGYKVWRVLPMHIDKDVDRFRDWYFSIVDNALYGLKITEPFHRPTIIAHSLGTWILAKALVKYPEIKFDKIFLFGSIIPQSFDWFKLILSNQVNSIIYEKAIKDGIVPLGWVFTGSFKPCGTKGFVQKSSFLKEEIFSHFGHSDFNYKKHFEEYIVKRLYEVPHQLAMIAGRELIETQVRRKFKESAKIDRIVYSTEYTNNEISLARAIEWFRIEKDIWTFAVNSYSGAVLGYINAIPLDDEAYNSFCSGSLQEKDILSSSIQDYDNSARYNLVILSVAISRTTRLEETMLNKGKIAEMLIMSSIYKINKHDKGMSKLRKMAAFAWTDEGKKLCQGFCMTKLPTTESNFPLYEIDFSKLRAGMLKGANFMSKWWYKQLMGI